MIQGIRTVSFYRSIKCRKSKLHPNGLKQKPGDAECGLMLNVNQESVFIDDKGQTVKEQIWSFTKLSDFLINNLKIGKI